MNKINKNKVLVVKDLSKIFETRSLFSKPKIFKAVNSISFDLHEGEILGFLGPNGAGKTTTIQMLLGLMTPTSGNISYFGKNLSAHRSEILESVTFASAYTKLAARLTVYENLDVFGQFYGIEKSERAKRIKDYLEFFEMWDIRNRRTGVLSAGQMTRIMLAKAFLPKPRVILLDEPTASLDPDVAIHVRDFIVRQKKEQNVSILFTSHNMTEVEEVCDRVLILKQGKIIANNTPHEIAKQISKTKVHLMLADSDFDKTATLLDEKAIQYTIDKPFIEIEIDEDQIAHLLSEIAGQKISYTQIYIDKPTLEDYFLEVAKQR